jgi:DNA-directed RNA polymerase alpha subunit
MSASVPASFDDMVAAAAAWNSPKFTNLEYLSSNDIRFTLTNANVSLANCIRRTILSDIPIVVMRTSPYTENQCTILANTSRFHNEIVLHRLSCIPVFMHIENVSKYELVLDIENTTKEALLVTTKDFQVRNCETKEMLSSEETRKIFPPSEIDGEEFYIEFLRLRSRIGPPDMVPGEKISLTCKFDVGRASENAAFNVVHTCHFTNTVDEAAGDEAWAQLSKTLEGKIPADEMNTKRKNFDLLERRQNCVPGSFDFSIKTLGDSIGARHHGHYDNLTLIRTAFEIIIERLGKVELYLNNGDTVIQKTAKTDYPDRSFDIVFKNEGYTIGKLLEYLVYDLFFRGGVAKTLLYCGFVKPHPHAEHSFLRLVFASDLDATEANARQLLLSAASCARLIFNSIKKHFMVYRVEPR